MGAVHRMGQMAGTVVREPTSCTILRLSGTRFKHMSQSRLFLSHEAGEPRRISDKHSLAARPAMGDGSPGRQGGQQLSSRWPDPSGRVTTRPEIRRSTGTRTRPSRLPHRAGQCDVVRLNGGHKLPALIRSRQAWFGPPSNLDVGVQSEFPQDGCDPGLLGATGCDRHHQGIESVIRV